MKSKVLSQFLDTFRRININYIYVILYDLLFFLPAFFIVIAWSNSVLSNYKGIEAKMALLQSMSNVESTAGAITAFIRSSLIYGVLMIVALYLLWCLSRSLVWTNILNRKFKFDFYKKFLLLNLIWVPVSAVLFLVMGIIASLIFFVLVTVPGQLTASRIVLIPYIYLVFIFILFPLIIYVFNFTSILYINFVKENRIKKAFENTASFSITKIGRLYLPYVFMGILFMLATLIAYPFRLINEQAYTFATVILLLLYFAWHKFYVSDLVTTKHL